MELYRQEGETARRVRVYVDSSGDLVLGSQDFPGPALRPFTGGAGEYEYDVRVTAAEKDRLLLALIAEQYQGSQDAVEEFRRFCESRGIPCRFSVWGSDYER